MRELGSWVYRLLRSKVLGALVILAMAVLALLGTLITQEPPGSTADPATHAAFLESIRPRYGGWTQVLDFLGIFNLWASPIFLGVTVLLALSIIACTVHRLPQLWKRATPAARPCHGEVLRPRPVPRLAAAADVAAGQPRPCGNGAAATPLPSIP